MHEVQSNVPSAYDDYCFAHNQCLQGVDGVCGVLLAVFFFLVRRAIDCFCSGGGVKKDN